MKKKVSAFVKNNYPNCFTSYSGNTRTMYITDNSGADFDVEGDILMVFGYKLPFRIATNK